MPNRFRQITRRNVEREVNAIRIGFREFRGLLLALPILFGGAAQSSAEAPIAGLTCDDTLKEQFRPDELTKVVLVKPYAKGDALVLPGDDPAMAPKVGNDICLVKLMVGPGNPGPEGAPSTSDGIGIEIWLPSKANWNERIHALGGGGFQGGAAGSADNIGNPMAAAVAFTEGAVSSSSDAGHASVPKNYGIPDSGGDFLMLPDGSPNAVLWHDYSVRALHEQAVKTKALTDAYYGRPARYSYWDGSSTGGRQGHKLAQAHPEDFDGIIANLPAINFVPLLASMLWPQLVFERDLGGEPLTVEQQDLVSRAAIKACDTVGGQHLGFIMDPAQCRYDPVMDPGVLCVLEGGANEGPECLTRKQAVAVNKIWYGPSEDGSVPDPAEDNGWNIPVGGKQLWFGPARGTSLWNWFFTAMLGRPAGVANPGAASFLGAHGVALAAGNPKLAGTDFLNGRGNGEDGWKELSYEEFAEAVRRGNVLDATTFSQINTDNPDLSAFEAAGGKLLFWHGTNDEVIPVQGSMQYYDSVVEAMGSLERVQDFYRFYVVPGAGHQSPNGTANPAANPPIFSRDGLYAHLVKWVEQGEAPGRIVLESPSAQPVTRSQPVCPYPAKARYAGGDPNAAESYDCAL